MLPAGIPYFASRGRLRDSSSALTVTRVPTLGIGSVE